MTTLNAELYDALIAIKVPEKKARAAAEAIGSPEHVATKANISALDAKITIQGAWIKIIIWGGSLLIGGLYVTLGFIIRLMLLGA